MNRARSLRWIGIIGALAVVVGGLWLAGRQQIARSVTTQPGRSRSSEAAAGSPLQAVEVIKPERAAMSRKLDVPGTIEAFEQADLYAKVAGYVAAVRVDIGDVVTAEETLAVLDVPEMTLELAEGEAQWTAQKAALAAAEAKVVQAQRMLDVTRSQWERWRTELTLKETTFRRQEELYGGKAITEQQFDEGRMERDVAQAELAIAGAKIAAADADVREAEAGRAVAASQVEVAASRVQKLKTLMGYARIVAPFNGIVTRRLVDRGALVQAATSSRTSPLFTVQRIDTVRVCIEVPESDLAYLRVGMTVRIKPFGLKEERTEGRITRVASALNPATRTMRTEIDLANPDGRLLHGMYAQVLLELDKRENALTIPATALLTEGKNQFVYAIQGQKAVRTPIKTGLDDGIRLEVTEGLKDDDLVVVTGKGLLSPDAAVRPVLRGAGS